MDCGYRSKIDDGHRSKTLPANTPRPTGKSPPCTTSQSELGSSNERTKWSSSSQPKIHFNRRLHGHRLIAFATWHEFPLPHSFDGFLIQTQSKTSLHFDVRGCA